MLETLGLGFLSGIRSTFGPAFASVHFAENRPRRLRRSRLGLLASPTVARVLQLMAVGELVVDKMPFVPARMEPPSLIMRAASGALTGAALQAARGRSQLQGALLGAAAAVAGSFVGYRFRMSLIEQGGVPNVVAGAVEDVAGLAAGLTLLSRDGL